jgi:hypothetical protein
MAKDKITSAENSLIESSMAEVDSYEALKAFQEMPAEWNPDIELTFEPFVDTWKFPRWCRLDEYAYGWLNRNDKDELYRAFESAKWRLVQRVNHPSGPDADFNMHGLVERMGQVLVFRPRWLDDKIRQIPVVKHIERSKQAEAKLTSGSVTDGRGRDVVIFEPTQMKDSDIIMQVEEPTTGQMLEVGGE